MSQRLYPDNIRLCYMCGSEIDIGKKQNRTKCTRCINFLRRDYYRNRYVPKTKKCRMCGGVMSGRGSTCSDYCGWRNGLKRRHYKIILRLEDLE